MQTLEAILKRKSVRGFKSEQISEKDLDTILNAACAAPVGYGDYDPLKLTVIQNRELLNKISDAYSKSDIFYGAPTVIAISSNKLENVNYSNAGCVAQNMLLAATDLGLGSVYVINLAWACEKDESLVKELGIGDGFFPVASVALGYPVEEIKYRQEFVKRIKTSKI